ncbi:uncharacterized protein LOC128551574, partial [Mercenaria mercenaria]|uniref:uncharacterized protein LOC128551574 n=1 Tax=Mercenaria mercenaria TaxID=6596 RepID=UPI00234F334C
MGVSGTKSFDTQDDCRCNPCEDLQEEVRPKKTAEPFQFPVLPKPQPLSMLLDRQLVCRNMAVDGECLSYMKNENGDVGLYVDKKRMSDGNYFEVEILSTGMRGSI